MHRLLQRRNWRRMDGWDIVILLLAFPAGAAIAAFVLALGMLPSAQVGMALSLAGFALRRILSPSLMRAEEETPPSPLGAKKWLSLPMIAVGVIVSMFGALGVFIMGVFASENGLDRGAIPLLVTVCVTCLGCVAVVGGIRIRRSR